QLSAAKESGHEKEVFAHGASVGSVARENAESARRYYRPCNARICISLVSAEYKKSELELEKRRTRS
ncbi:MAG: hypothetical protein ACI9WU_003738, partial [Myxococcota bacterium]